MRRKAFTLVELLVVIGIIALLIAILLPTLRKARDAANQTKCLSNIRELTMGWLMYAEAHKGKLVYAGTSAPASTPAPGDPDNKPGDDSQCWVKNGNTNQVVEEGALFPYVKQLPLYRCVADSTFNARSYSINNYCNGEW